MLLYGGPALSLDEFRDFQPDVIIGTMLEVTAPIGQYDSDKLLNVGTNRWSFKPEIGISKTLGPLTLELASGVRFYTDNNDFLDGQTSASQPDLFCAEPSHLLLYFRDMGGARWSLLYRRAPTIDGKKGETRANARVGLTLTLPVNRYNSVKLYGSTGVYTKTGTDFDLVGIVWQLRWGGGL